MELYLLIASMWFYLEYKDTKNVVKSFIVGLFWIYEVFIIISNKLK